MAEPAAVLQILLTANTLQANAALAKTQGQLATTGKTAAATGATMKKAMLGIGVAAAAAGVALFKVGEEFDDAYDKISTRTGATGREMQKLKGVFRDVVGDVPATFDEAATAVGDLNTRLGLSGKPLGRMSKQMTELSRITETSLATNVESVSKAFVDWEVKTKNMSKTLDGFFRLSQESGASVDEIAAAVQKFGSPLRQLGFSLGEAASMWATFVRAGVNTQTMVPGLKLAISNLTRPTDELGAAMEKLGISVGKPDVALRQILELLGKGSTLSQIERTGLAMDVFGKRAGADMAEAIKQGRFEVDEMLKVFKGGEGTIREQGRRTMDLAEHWQKFTNLLKLQVEPIATDVFKGLGDLMKDVSKAFKRGGFEEVLDLLVEKLSQAIPKIAELGGKIGLKLVEAVVKGFINAPLLGKLFIAGTFIHLIGGRAVLTALGTSLGGPVGLAMAMAIAAKLGADFGKSQFMKDIFQITDVMEYALDHINDLTDKEMKRAINIARKGGQKITENVIWAWVHSGKISAEEASRLISLMKEVDTKGGKALLRYADQVRKTGEDVRSFTDKAGRYFKGWSQKTIDLCQKVARAFKDPLSLAFDNAADRAQSFADKTLAAVKRMQKGTDKSNDKVVGSFDNMVNRVGDGIRILGRNLDSALDKMGVKKSVGFTLEQAGKTAKAQSRQTGGRITPVPGYGNGDKVPAMLEPGEVVINKKAVAAMGGAQRANRINKLIPRFAKGGIAKMFAAGGVAQPPGDPGSEVVQAAYAGAVGKFLQRFGMDLTQGYNPGGPSVSPGHLSLSAPPSLDVVPLGGDWDGSFAQGLKWALSQGMQVGYDGQYGTQAWSGHGEGDHAHIDWNDSAGKLGAIVEKLSRIILKGPDGPLKDIGQAALDKTWKAANAYLAKKTRTTEGVEGSFGPPANLKNLPADFERYNKIYPITSGFGDGYAMPLNHVAAIAEWAGAPGISMAKTAIGESQLEPGAVGYDSNTVPGASSVGHGLWMITTGVGNDDMINALGGAKTMRNPLVNAVAMSKIFASSGYGAWYSSTKDTSNTHYTGNFGKQLGGIIQKFAKGGVSVGKGRLTGKGEYDGIASVSTYDTMPLIKAQRVRDKINALVSETGTIAKLQDKIDITEWMHSLNSSELGTELGPGEIRRQVGLLQERLAFESRVAELARVGMKWTHRGMKNAPKGKKAQLGELRSAFAGNLLDFTGASGKTGRIWETKMSIFDLLGTKIDTDMDTKPALDISGLRSVIEAAQYGTFAGMFANGGHIPAGKWGIAGERGPEPVYGGSQGATVLPNSALGDMGKGRTFEATVPLHIELDGQIVRKTVRMELREVDRIEHHKSRQYAQ